MRWPRRNSSISPRESSRGIPLPPPGPAIRLSVGHTEMVVLRRWFLTALCLGLVVAAGAVGGLLASASAGVAASESGLAGISLPGLSGNVERLSVRGPD